MHLLWHYAGNYRGTTISIAISQNTVLTAFEDIGVSQARKRPDLSLDCVSQYMASLKQNFGKPLNWWYIADETSSIVFVARLEDSKHLRSPVFNS